MATIINTPGGSRDDSGWGMLLGIIIAILIVVLFFVYALPVIRNSNNNQAPQNGDINVNLKLPSQNNTGTPSTPSGGTTGGTTY